MRQILRGGVVLTMNARGDVFSPGEVVIEGQHIARVGADETSREAGGVGAEAGVVAAEAGVVAAEAGAVVAEAGAVVVDCRGCLVMPGLVNTHTHACGALFRGLAEDRPREAWAPSYALPRQEATVPEDYYWGAMLGALEMLTSGVTCAADRFSHMDLIAQALDRIGLRAVVCHTLVDRDQRLAWDQATALIERWSTSPDARVHCGIGPHATDTCSDGLLRRIRGLADQTGARVFIHCAQSEAEIAALRARGHAGAVRCLKANGLLGSDVVAAHCIYVDAEEVRLLAETGTWVAHCPASNAKTEGRLPPMGAMLAAGVHVVLGTDWAPTNNGMDLFDEMKSAGLLNKVTAGDPAAMPVDRLLPMVTIDAARALGLGAQVGSLEVGKRADVIALAMDAPHLQPWHRLAATLAYSAKGRDVRHVWVDGRWLVRDRQPVEIDVAEVHAQVARIWRRLGAPTA